MRLEWNIDQKITSLILMRLEWNLTVAGMVYKNTIRGTNYCHFYSYLLCQKVAWSNFPIFFRFINMKRIKSWRIKKKKKVKKNVVITLET
jgi:hypothetical protein